MVMKMKWLLCMMVMVAALGSTAQADVYIVAKDVNSGARDAMEAFLGANFSAGTLGTINKGQYRSDSGTSATADDLVIFLRESGPGMYDDNVTEITGWGNLPAPILMMHFVMERSSK